MGQADGSVKVFISYRREDAAPYAGRLADSLEAALGRGSVFMDVDSIGAGLDFVAEIDRAISRADAVLVVIGPRWLAQSDDGRSRLEDPQDFVRLEIETALGGAVRVIPVLVGGATMPAESELPPSLGPLTRLNAVELLDRKWHDEVEDLTKTIATGRPVRQRAVPAQERKYVTVLFCEYAASAANDPEDAAAHLRAYEDLVVREIGGYGGTVERAGTDGLLAIFGIPTAHEDDAERAVRAGLRIVDAARDLNDGRGSPQSGVRIGIDTGEVLATVRRTDGTSGASATGAVVSNTPGLARVANDGEVVVGTTTRQVAGEIVEWEQLAELANGSTAFKAGSVVATLGVDVATRHTTPFVGRETDLALLTAAFDKTVGSSNVQLVTILGEPGVGKSRLVAELLQYADEQSELVRWRQGRCLPYGDGITFWALGEIVKAEAGILETDDPTTAQAQIERVVPDDAIDAPWVRQRLYPLVGLDASAASLDENFAAWRQFLELLAEGHPSVLIFEDMHWADDALVSFIKHVADFSDGVPLMLICTARPEFQDRVSNWGRLRNSLSINLSPLSDREITTLVSALLSDVSLADEARDVILERSGGNPLYAEEFARLFKDLQGREPALGGQSEIPLPLTVQGLIAARLDSLDVDAKSLIHDGSVFGKVFWSGAIAALEALDRVTVEEELRDLGRREFVRPARRSSVEGEREYSFSHGLLRDVAYGQIPRQGKIEKHVEAARWIAQLARDRPEEHAEILAAHYVTALDLATAAASVETEALRAEAIRYLILAGDRALKLNVESAERHYARALEMLEPQDEQRPRALIGHAEALLLRSRYADAAAEFEEGIAGLRRQGDERSVALALLRDSLVLWHLGDPRGRELDREAVAILERLGPSPELVRALAVEASDLAMTDGDAAAGVAVGERAVQMAASLGLDPPVTALMYRGMARIYNGDGEGLDDLREAVSEATAQGLGRERLQAMRNLASMELNVGLVPHAVELSRDGLALAERLRVDEMVMTFRGILAASLVSEGSWEEALVKEEELARDLEERGEVFDLLTSKVNQAMILVERGEESTAEEMADSALARARQTGEHQMVAMCLYVAMYVQYCLGHESTARDLLMEMLGPDLRDAPIFMTFIGSIVEVAVGLGMLDVAKQTVAERTSRLPGEAAALDEAHAFIAEAEGRYEDAAELWTRVGQAADESGNPPSRAFALLAKGRCLAAVSRCGDALEPLRSAQKMFEAFGARRRLEEVGALLADCAGARS